MPVTPKKTALPLTESIAAEVARHTDGVGIETLNTALSGLTSKRTLQRRLGEMLQKGQISREGRGPGTRYRLPRARGVNVGENIQVPDNTSTETLIPISVEGNQIRDYLRQPIQKRKPVGYDRALLEVYVPNSNYYLEQHVRIHLDQIGRRTDAERPAGTYARDLLGRLLIDLSWASSRLEGNTYSRLDTQNLIEHGQEAEGRDRLETQMILNHKNAIEMLVEQADEIGFNTYTFFNLHALLSENLLSDPRESGRLRERNVEVSGTVFLPLSIPQQIDQHFRLMLNKADAIIDPFEQAFFCMVHSPYLQPFIDVNKRVSRLAANIPLIRHNLCPLSFVDVPVDTYIDGILGVYELKRLELLRDVFVWAYERSCQRYMAIRATTAEPDPIRLRYREDIIAVVADVVRNMHAPNAATVKMSAAKLVPQSFLNRVIDFIVEDLQNLHEGNVARYRLRLSEYHAWAAKYPRN